MTRAEDHTHARPSSLVELSLRHHKVAKLIPSAQIILDDMVLVIVHVPIPVALHLHIIINQKHLQCDLTTLACYH